MTNVTLFLIRLQTTSPSFLHHFQQKIYVVMILISLAKFLTNVFFLYDNILLKPLYIHNYDLFVQGVTLYSSGVCWHERASFQQSSFGRLTAGNDLVATILISLFFSTLCSSFPPLLPFLIEGVLGSKECPLRR